MFDDGESNRMGDLIVPALSTAPGTYWCLHLPSGCYDQRDRLEEDCSHLASRRGQTAVVARPADPHRGIRFLFRPEASVEWLTREAGVSWAEAEEIVAALPVHVGTLLRQIAGNPRCLLGLAAAFYRKPDVLIYSVSGTDPAGRDAAFRYVEARRSGLSVVHVSPVPASGSREAIGKCLDRTLAATGVPGPMDGLESTPRPDGVCPSAAKCVPLLGATL